MADKKKKLAEAPVRTFKSTTAEEAEQRRAEDDQLISDAATELQAAEAKLGHAIDVTVDDSHHSGNCYDGVVAWRALHAGGRSSVPAQEMLQIAAECRDRVPLVVRGVRKSIAKAVG